MCNLHTISNIYSINITLGSPLEYFDSIRSVCPCCKSYFVRAVPSFPCVVYMSTSRLLAVLECCCQMLSTSAGICPATLRQSLFTAEATAFSFYPFIEVSFLLISLWCSIKIIFLVFLDHLSVAKYY